MKLLTLLGCENRCMHVITGMYYPEKLPGKKIVIPVRDPGAVWISHYQRRLKDKVSFTDQYKRLQEVMRIYPTMLMPVDTPIKPIWFIDTELFLGINHEAWHQPEVLAFLHEWPMVGKIEYERDPPGPIPPEVEWLRKKWGYNSPFVYP